MSIWGYPWKRLEALSPPAISQFSHMLTDLNNTSGNIRPYFLRMLWTFSFTALKLLKFAPVDFPWRFKSPFKLYWTTKNTVLPQIYRTGEPHPTLHMPRPSVTLLSDRLAAHLLVSKTRKHTVSFHFLWLLFEMSSVCPFHFQLVFNRSSEFPETDFSLFKKKCLFSTNKTFIFVCLITPALLSPFYFFVFGSEVYEPSVPLKQFA